MIMVEITLEWDALNSLFTKLNCHTEIFFYFKYIFLEMNRHHYALYVHNCRLVFLLRKDFDQADTFRPAEFHWKLDQVFSFFLPVIPKSFQLL